MCSICQFEYPTLEYVWAVWVNIFMALKYEYNKYYSEYLLLAQEKKHSIQMKYPCHLLQVKNMPPSVTNRWFHSMSTVAVSHICAWLMVFGEYYEYKIRMAIRLLSGWIPFRIIWRRWCQAYQWSHSPMHGHWHAVHCPFSERLKSEQVVVFFLYRCKATLTEWSLCTVNLHTNSI